MIVTFAALVACLLGVAATEPATRPLNEKQKIEAILSTIESLQGATFIRNGSEYDCHAAADHLRAKWKSAGSRIGTAEQFIDQLASKSSMSGKPYTIRLADGGTFLRLELKKLDAP